MKQLKSAPHSHPVRQVALGALFLAFLKVSLCGFGGGLFWARRVVVEQRQWMDDQEFAETLTLCQLMPGPNIVGITVCVGAKLRGATGALVAVAGFVLLPWILGLSLGAAILRHAQLAVLQNILIGRGGAADGHRIAAADAFAWPPYGTAVRLPGADAIGHLYYWLEFPVTTPVSPAASLDCTVAITTLRNSHSEIAEERASEHLAGLAQIIRLALTYIAARRVPVKRSKST